MHITVVTSCRYAIAHDVCVIVILLPCNLYVSTLRAYTIYALNHTHTHTHTHTQPEQPVAEEEDEDLSARLSALRS